MQKVDVALPKWGPNMVSGVLVEWLKKVGEPVQAGEALCRVETEKVTSEVQAPCGGTVAEILVPEGDEVEVGTVLCRIAGGQP